MTHKEQVISEAIAAKCCDGSVDHYRACASDDAHAEAHPLNALWAVKYCPSYTITADRRDWCAERMPLAALMFAADRITPERRDWCKQMTAR